MEQSNLTTQGVGVGLTVSATTSTVVVVAFPCLAAVSTVVPIAPAVATAAMARSSPAATAAPRRTDTIVVRRRTGEGRPKDSQGSRTESSVRGFRERGAVLEPTHEGHP